MEEGTCLKNGASAPIYGAGIAHREGSNYSVAGFTRHEALNEARRPWRSPSCTARSAAWSSWSGSTGWTLSPVLSIVGSAAGVAFDRRHVSNAPISSRPQSIEAPRQPQIATAPHQADPHKSANSDSSFVDYHPNPAEVQRSGEWGIGIALTLGGAA